MLEEVLHQEQMQQLTFKDLSSLLETCLLGCPDRACAISLVRVRSTLLQNTQPGMVDSGTSMLPVNSSRKATKYAQVSTHSLCHTVMHSCPCQMYVLLS